ncbi:MAG TPA: hypothetical protein VND22_09070 [Actinomycetota bacterium]|nr:hypothetical protein [Actinomycetota bacterium]
MKRFLFLAVTMLALGLLSAGPALAQTAPSISYVYSNSNRYTPSAGSTITGSWTVIVQANASSSLRSFRTSIEAAESGIPSVSGGAASRNYSWGETSSAELRIPWDTTTITPYNGVYRITSYADTHVGSASTSANVNDIKVNNPPDTPSDLRSAVEGENVMVRWDANSEPDIVSYKVSRSVDGGSYSQVATVSPTSSPTYKDVAPPKGKALRYEVAALRRSPVTVSIASAPARTSSASTVPLPPPSPSPSPTGSPNPDGTTGNTTNRGTSSGNNSISGPLPAAPIAEGKGPVTAAPQVKARRDLGNFSTTLPYEEGEVPVPVEFADDPDVPNALERPMEALASASQLVQGTVHTPRFIAASVLMLIMALHLVRLSRKLLTAPE